MGLLETTINKIQPADADWRAKAKKRLDMLTMPHWALGRLMDMAGELAAMTRSLTPPVAKRTVVVMAGDHGVVAQGVSKYPSEVTPQMVHNFVAGGAGINAMAKVVGAKVVVVDMGVAGDLSALAESGKIISRRVAPGTADFTKGPAMTAQQARQAIEAGIEVAESLIGTTDVFGTGDMGIGNTTPSTAIAAAVTGKPIDQLAGRGTGIDDEALKKKAQAIRKGLDVNKPDPNNGLDLLAKVGGFEIGGIAGLILGAAGNRRPVLVDGFISTAAALIARAIAPASVEYMIAAHRSAEPGHHAMQHVLGKHPLLDLGLRLGEGTGAALAMALVEASARLLTDVATFDEAGVSKAK